MSNQYEMQKIKLVDPVKDKLFKMLFLFFPKFIIIRLNDNGIISLRKKGIFTRTLKVSLVELLLYYIPNEISISRWGNYQYTSFIVSKIVEILNNPIIPDMDHKVEACINYLHSEFLNSKIINIYGDINEVIVPTKDGYLKYSRNLVLPPYNTSEEEKIEDAKIIKGNGGVFVKKLVNIKENVQPILTKYKSIAAGIMLSLMFNYRTLFLSFLNDISSSELLIFTKTYVTIYQDYPWKILSNTS